MAEFYKSLFAPFQRSWLEQKKRSAMSNLLSAFASKHFAGVLERLHSPASQAEFVNMLMAVVHSHRHNKGDPFIAESTVDFSLVRDTMYKYSKKAQERFFSLPVFAFLFAWFASSEMGLLFTQAKFKSKGEEYLKRMQAEIDELKQEAIEWLLRAAKLDHKCQLYLSQLK